MRILMNGIRLLCAAFALVTLTAPPCYAAPRVENVRFDQQEDRVLIFYDLHGSEEAYTVALKLSSDGGRRFDIFPKTLSGDVGENVSSGTGRRMVWDALKDMEKLSGDRFVFAVTASWEGGSTEGMVWIPGGTFQMGSNSGDDDEKPVHRVRVDGFYMDATEVTVGQFRAFVEATEYRTTAEKEGWAYVYTGSWEKRKGASWRNPGFRQADDHPVVCVSWHDAVAYAQWAGKRLPTEAEWEYAARGGLEGKKYPWGNSISHDQANYSGTGGRDRWEYTAPVGNFSPNGYGLHDMAGNVWEWCSDWYDENYYSRSPSSNPTGANTGTYRVLRGGSWIFNPLLLRCANRYRNSPVNRFLYYGFRCARTP